jgi:hypothetical protein
MIRGFNPKTIQKRLEDIESKRAYKFFCSQNLKKDLKNLRSPASVPALTMNLKHLSPIDSKLLSSEANSQRTKSYRGSLELSFNPFLNERDKLGRLIEEDVIFINIFFLPVLFSHLLGK